SAARGAGGMARGGAGGGASGQCTRLGKRPNGKWPNGKSGGAALEARGASSGRRPRSKVAGAWSATPTLRRKEERWRGATPPVSAPVITRQAEGLLAAR